MSYGACLKCGCAHAECECVPVTPPEPKRVDTFTSHGTYIRDFQCFERIEVLSAEEAYDLLLKSEWIKDKPRPSSNPPAHFLFNKGWAINAVDRERGYLSAVYNHDGRYTLWRASIPSFLACIRDVTAWDNGKRHIYEALTSPYEHA
jgi:hypothetical protein